MIKKIALYVILLIASVIAAGAALAKPTVEITVSAAISLKSAFEEIGKLYESQNTACKVVFNFGSSGDLVAQIKGGAPVDVFASAAVKEIDDLDREGFIVEDTKMDFAANSIVLIVPSSSKLVLASFEDLKKAEIKKIAIGNPKSVPVGRYADETFQYYKIFNIIADKLVYAENVRQVLDYVARNEVDAGVVYSTDAMMMQQEIKVAMTAPDVSHKPIIYPIAVVKGTKNEKSAKAFISLVTSDKGRKILSKYGIMPIAQAK